MSALSLNELRFLDTTDLAPSSQSAPVNWCFTSQDARRKMARLYPRSST